MLHILFRSEEVSNYSYFVFYTYLLVFNFQNINILNIPNLKQRLTVIVLSFFNFAATLLDIKQIYAIFTKILLRWAGDHSALKGRKKNLI